MYLGDEDACALRLRSPLGESKHDEEQSDPSIHAVEVHVDFARDGVGVNKLKSLSLSGTQVHPYEIFPKTLCVVDEALFSCLSLDCFVVSVC